MNGLPLHILRPTSDHSSFELDVEAMAILEAIQTPVTVVSIIGSQRGGKSTLMNLFCSRRCSGFSVGHYMDPQTTGIWIRVRPHPRNKDITVLLLDTEGLDSPHVRQDYNWILSAFVLLISNAFVYQTKGSIDANAIDRLGVILRVAEQLRGTGPESAKESYPSFMWLLRDHHLTMTQATPKDEMMTKLDGASIKALGRVFKTSDCFPLPRPVDADSQLKQLETMAFDQLQEKFKEEYVIFERTIFQLVSKPVSFAGQVITGSVLAELFRKYTAAVASKEGILSELSQLPTQQQMIIQLAGERAVRASVTVYRDQMLPLFDKMPLGEEQLANGHHEARGKALALFEAEAEHSGGGESSKTSQSVDHEMWDKYRTAVETQIALFRSVSRSVAVANDDPSDNSNSPEEQQLTVNFPSKKLASSAVPYRSLESRELVGGLYAHVWRANSHASHAACQKVLSSLTEPLAKKVSESGFSSVDEFDKAVTQLVANYEGSETARGISRPLLLKIYLENEQRSARESVLRVSQQRRFEEQFQQQAAYFREDMAKLKAELSEELAAQKLETQASFKAAQEVAKAAEAERAERERAAVAASEKKAQELAESISASVAKEATRVTQLEVESARLGTKVQSQAEFLQETKEAAAHLRTDTSKRLDECFAGQKEGLAELKASTSQALADKMTGLQKDVARDIERLQSGVASIQAQIEKTSAAETSAVNALELRLATKGETVQNTQMALAASTKEGHERLESQVQQCGEAVSKNNTLLQLTRQTVKEEQERLANDIVQLKEETGKLDSQVQECTASVNKAGQALSKMTQMHSLLGSKLDTELASKTEFEALQTEVQSLRKATEDQEHDVNIRNERKDKTLADVFSLISEMQARDKAADAASLSSGASLSRARPLASTCGMLWVQ